MSCRSVRNLGVALVSAATPGVVVLVLAGGAHGQPMPQVTPSAVCPPDRQVCVEQSRTASPSAARSPSSSPSPVAPSRTVGASPARSRPAPVASPPRPRRAGTTPVTVASPDGTVGHAGSGGLGEAAPAGMPVGGWTVNWIFGTGSGLLITSGLLLGWVAWSNRRGARRRTTKERS